MPSSNPQSKAPSGDLYDDEAVDFRRLWAAIWRQRLLILVLSLGGLLAGFGLTRLLQPVYEAQASLQLPVASSRNFGSANPLRSAPLFEGRGWLELLGSYAVLDEVVRKRRLYLELASSSDSSFFSTFAIVQQARWGEYVFSSDGKGTNRLSSVDGTILDSAPAGDSLGRPLGLLWTPPSPGGLEVRFRIRSPRDAAVRLNSEMQPILPLDGALLKLSLRGYDAPSTAATVNAIADQFVDVATRLKREKLTTVTEALREQLEVARLKLTSEESALEQYQVNTITLPSDRGATPITPGLAETRDPVRQAFFKLRTDRDELVRDRDAIQRAVDGTTSGTSLTAIPAVRESAELMGMLDSLTSKRGEARQMRVAFSSTYPPLRQLEAAILEIERVEIPRQAANLRQMLDARITELDSRIAASSREMQQIPVRASEESRRERNRDMADKLYKEVQAAYESARLAELSLAPDVRLLDYAVPPTRPVSDIVFLVIAAGFILGFGSGVAVAIVRDRFDRRIRYPEQVTRDLGLQILGALPLQRKGRDGKPREDDRAMLIEMARSIRTGLLFAHGSGGPFVVTITSPGSGDGKSFVSLLLAQNLALAGRRTLLIDGDNRRGHLHRTLKVDRRPGLAEVLSNQCTLAEAIVRPEGEEFDLLPTGTPRANIPELLSSTQMTRLMMEVRGSYEAIVIDSPPLGAGVDPIVLASLSGTLALVLRNGLTDRELASARLNDLRRLSIRVLGAVLNDVKPKGAYQYYSYLPGYAAVGEVAAEPARRRLPQPAMVGDDEPTDS